jgi:hypothetical protein
MRGNIAIVREALSKLPNVSRTWFEWSWEDAMWVKTLVIEVEFDTDPNSVNFSQLTLDAIEKTVIGVLNDDTTMTVSYVALLSRSQGSDGRAPMRTSAPFGERIARAKRLRRPSAGPNRRRFACDPAEDRRKARSARAEV